MPQISNEFWGAVGAIFFFGSAVIGWLNTRRTDKVAAKVETTAAKVADVETTANTASTKADESKSAVEGALLKLVERQTGIQADQVKIQAEMLDNQRSSDAKGAAERQSFVTSIDRMAAAVEAMTAAIVVTNTLGSDVKASVTALPETITKAQEKTVSEVNEHMDTNNEELTKRLDSIDHNIAELRTLILSMMSAKADPPPIPADKPPSETTEVKEPQS